MMIDDLTMGQACVLQAFDPATACMTFGMPTGVILTFKPDGSIVRGPGLSDDEATVDVAAGDAEVIKAFARFDVAGFFGDVREWESFVKVEWPNRSQVVQGTIVVIIACVIVGAFLSGADQIFKPFVRTVAR